VTSLINQYIITTVQAIEDEAVPSNKDKVTSYLEDDESLALSNFCKKNGCSGSQGVALLVRKSLLEETVEISNLYDERLKRLERTLDNCMGIFFRCNETTDKLGTLLAMTQEDVDRIALQLKEQEIRQFDDEIIAAITGQPVQKVYLWRMGLIKPRGRRILEKLAPYQIYEGRWIRR
jgi:hypothetical protein